MCTRYLEKRLTNYLNLLWLIFGYEHIRSIFILFFVHFQLILTELSVNLKNISILFWDKYKDLYESMLFVLDFIDLTLVTKRVTANPTTVKYSYNVMKNIER